MQNWLEKACDESGLSTHDCAQILGQPDEYFDAKKRYPGTLTLNELFALNSAFSAQGRIIMWKALDELKF